MLIREVKSDHAIVQHGVVCSMGIAAYAQKRKRDNSYIINNAPLIEKRKKQSIESEDSSMKSEKGKRNTQDL